MDLLLAAAAFVVGAAWIWGSLSGYLAAMLAGAINPSWLGTVKQTATAA